MEKNFSVEARNSKEFTLIKGQVDNYFYAVFGHLTTNCDKMTLQNVCSENKDTVETLSKENFFIRLPKNIHDELFFKKGLAKKNILCLTEFSVLTFS